MKKLFILLGVLTINFHSKAQDKINLSELVKEVKNQLDTGIFHIGPHFHTDVQSTFYSTISEYFHRHFHVFIHQLVALKPLKWQ